MINGKISLEEELDTLILETVPDKYQETLELIKLQDGKYMFVINDRILLIQNPQD